TSTAAGLRRAALSIGRGGAAGRAQVLRGPDGRARQRRRARDRARAGGAAPPGTPQARSGGGALQPGRGKMTRGFSQRSALLSVRLFALMAALTLWGGSAFPIFPERPVTLGGPLRGGA